MTIGQAAIRPGGRRKSRSVQVGEIMLGGNAPVAIQSMTTTDTLDVEATARQVLSLVAAGCPLVRVTAPSRKAVRALAALKERLSVEGCRVPIIADIHFTPRAAIDACGVVEKVRVNPGNFVDRKRFVERTYSEEEYAEEIDRVGRAFRPLLAEARRHRAAVRIGANHGSLADRIVNRVGDTPRGIVESVIEFSRIASGEGFERLVVSAKASSVKVMVAANRLLALSLDEEKLSFPMHLGVTEAGDGMAGRIKSAIGIGTLLLEGIGDTIRVSLTERPEKEIPVCREILAVTDGIVAAGAVRYSRPGGVASRRKSRRSPCGIGGEEPVKVVIATESDEAAQPGGGPTAEAFEIPSKELIGAFRERGCDLPLFVKAGDSSGGLAEPGCYPSVRLALGRVAAGMEFWTGGGLLTIVGDPDSTLRDMAELVKCARDRLPNGVVVAFDPASGEIAATEAYRCLADLLPGVPLLLRGSGRMIEDAVILGSLLQDGIGDAVLAPSATGVEEMLYALLQGAGSRITQAEFVSCPSCGRTVFDLEETTARIKQMTAHLTGVKIAVMGCIVNGPGEMADADFGYVGAAPGKVHLFAGKDLVAASLEETEAPEKLVELIRSRGRWEEPT